MFEKLLQPTQFKYNSSAFACNKLNTLFYQFDAIYQRIKSVRLL